MKTNQTSQMLRGVIYLIPLLLLGIPARANVIHFHADLSGPNESPANASPGTGWADVFVDEVAKTMLVQVTFSGLLGNTTASHIHAITPSPDAGTAGIATATPNFLGFPIGVTAGSYDHLYDMTLATSFNPSFVTTHGGSLANAFAAFEAGMLANTAYLNIHTTVVPGGEIRGFLHNVPDSSSTVLLLGLGLSGMAWLSRAQRKLAA